MVLTLNERNVDFVEVMTVATVEMRNQAWNPLVNGESFAYVQ